MIISKPLNDDSFRRALRSVASTADGAYVLRRLCQYLGLKSQSLAFNNQGIIDRDMTTYNEAQRIVWMTIAAELTMDQRNLIEAEQSGDNTNDR